MSACRILWERMGNIFQLRLRQPPVVCAVFSNSLLSWTGRWFTLLLAVLLTGCAFLPSDGPSAQRINEHADQTTEATPYQIVPITGKVVQVLQKSESASSDSGLSTLASPPAKAVREEGTFRVTGLGNLPPPLRQKITAGDTLNITIFESGGGLFGPLVPNNPQAPQTGSTTLPPQVVDESGQITVPFVGRVDASGKTAYEIEQEIVVKLKNKVINPQAIVSVAERKGGDLVSVTGDVKASITIPIPLSGLHLLEALTAAGGAIGDPHIAKVTVLRGSQARTDSLAEVFSDATKNIALQPGDTVVVRSDPWTYLAFGAMLKPGTFAFSKPDLTLADAMATAGGADDSRAYPTIYLYRLEPTRFVKQMGVHPVDPSAPTTPIIYNLDLTTPQGFFLAQRFAMRNKDIVYFSNASSVGVLKLFGLINAVTAPARTGFATGVQGATGINNINN